LEGRRTGGTPEFRSRLALFYSRDAYGLGQFSRVLTLCRGLLERARGVAPVVITGSPLPSLFQVPDGVDYVKLPAVHRTSWNEFQPRSLPLPFQAVRDLRRDLILDTVRHLRPDALVVDTFPTGLAGEIMPALEHVRRTAPHSKLVLGLRDVVADSVQVRETWEREGIYRLIEETYDKVLVYGQQALYDVVAEYGLPPLAASKVRYVGYLGRSLRGQSRASRDSRRPLALVTAGSGTDGYPLLEAAARAVQLSTAYRFLLIAGPLMGAEDRRRLRRACPKGSSLRLLDAVADLMPYITRADVVVSMCGYSTVCEILSARTRSVLVPRVSLGGEQLIRAAIMERLGVARMLEPGQLTPVRLLDAIGDALAQPEPPWHRISLDGVAGAVQVMDDALASGSP
jgi:predicted glycosyltransferase